MVRFEYENINERLDSKTKTIIEDTDCETMQE